MDLSQLSDADLKAVAAGDMSKVSEDGLKMLAAGDSAKPISGPGMLFDAAKAVIGQPVADLYNKVTAPDQAMLGTERKVAQGIGKVGKATTEAVSDISPTAGKVAEFALPQNEAGGQGVILGAPIGALAGAAASSEAGQFLGRKVAGLGEGISEGAKNLLRYAESKGLPLSAADISGSKALQSLENLLGKTPLGSDEMKAFRDKQIAALRSVRDRLAEKFGTSEDATVLDQIAKDAIATESKAMRDQADVLYGKVGELSKDAIIPMNQTRQAALNLLGKELRLRPDLRHKGIVDAAAKALGVDPSELTPELLDKMRGEWPSSFDFANLRGFQRQMGGIIDAEDAARKLGAPGMKFMGSAEAGAAKNLFAASERDLAAYAKNGGGELKKAYDVASDFYKNGVETFNAKAVKQMLRADSGRVVDTVFRPGAVTPIRAVKTALGGDAKAWRALKGQFVERLLPEVGDNLTPQTFQKALDKYGEPTLREIFTPQELMQFKGLARLTQAAGKAASLAGTQGSATTNTVLASGGIAGGLIVHNPVTGIPGAAAVVLGPKAVAKLYLSDAGRKLLLDGFTTPAVSQKAAATAGAITGYLGSKSLADSESNP